MSTLIVSTMDDSRQPVEVSFPGCDCLSENGSLLVFPPGGDRPVAGFADGWWTTFKIEEGR